MDMDRADGDHMELATASARLSLLPVEIWGHIVPFLTGWELFNLTSVNQEAHAVFSDAKWWDRLIHSDWAAATHSPDTTTTTSAASSQSRYTDQQSFAFALDGAHALTSKNGAPLGLTAAFAIPFVFGRDIRAFSVEIWFALRGPSDGGIVLGAGTPFHVSPSWNPLFEPWVHVDADGNLFGSVMPYASEKEPVATRLDRDRWHHVAITFETNAAVHVPGMDRDQWRVGEERVYVNGDLASVQRGSLSRFWIFNSFVLLGTGCSSQASSQSSETKEWRPFKGVVDDMRVWHSVLTPNEIKTLATHNTAVQLTTQPVHSWKTLATNAAPKRLEDHSIEFRGSHDSRFQNRGVSVPVVNRSNFQRGLLEDRLEFHPFCPDASSSFAIEVWFYLLPEDDHNWGGGVILGAQSRDVEDPYSPAHSRQVIHVDRSGRLFASVLDEIMFPSAQRLAPHKWHHVVLRYHDGTQDVFLNGIRKRSSHGALLRDWSKLSHMQVGTGCVNSARGSPKGWYGFHGRIRELRIWGPRLKDRQLATILSSSDATHVGSIKHLQPVFSLQRDGRLPHFVCVQNSRPSERVFVPRIDKPVAKTKTKPVEKARQCQPNHRLASPPAPLADGAVLAPRPSHSSKWLRSMWRKATSH